MNFVTASRNQPRICVVGNSKFTQVIHSLVDEFKNVAQITVIDNVFNDAVRAARELIDARQVDFFVSAGANAFYLKDTLSVPVLGLRVSSEDLIHAVLTARLISRRILLLTYERQETNLDVLKIFDDIEVLHCTYTTAEEIKEVFHQHRSEGYGVVIGSSYACDLADQWGLGSVLIYSRSSCRNLLRKATRLAGQNARQLQKDSLLQFALDSNPCPTVITTQGNEVVAWNSAALTQIPHFAQRRRLNGLLDKHACNAQRLQAEQLLIEGHPCTLNKEPFDLADGTPAAVYRFQFSRAGELRSDGRRLVSSSQCMAEVQNLLSVYGVNVDIVLLYGETGTGKELAARTVHAASDHASGSFIAVNCSAIPVDLFESELFGYMDGAFTGARSGGRTGLLETANGGSFFLDEINALTLAHQAKLLRVLQEKEMTPVGARKPVALDIKFIAACNVDLAEETRAGRFREDLYYRINTFAVRMPALRERPEDIVALTSYMVHRAVTRYRANIDIDVLVAGLVPRFKGYHWPGNVRELKSVIQRAVAHAAEGCIGGVEIARAMQPRLALPDDTEGNERRERHRLRELCIETAGDWRRLVELTRVSRSTLYRQLRDHGLSLRQFRHS